MPIHESSIGVLLPRPHMQRVERRKSEAVRCIEQVQQLPHQLRRRSMRGIPHVLQHQKIRADQPQPPVRCGLVNHDLGPRGIQTIVSGFALPDDAIHAPNESYRLRSLELNHSTSRALFEQLGNLS